MKKKKNLISLIINLIIQKEKNGYFWMKLIHVIQWD